MSEITLAVLPTNEEIVADPINTSHAILEVARDAAAKAEENIAIAGSAIESAGIASDKAAEANASAINAAESEGNTLNYKNAAEQAVASTLVFRNKLINGNFIINQDVVSGTVVLTAGQYGHDMWKAGASGCTYTFATVANVTTLTIIAGSLLQIVEGINLQSDTHVLSWIGTAQGKIGGGSYGNSGVTGTATGGANLIVEFNAGTLGKIQLEEGTIATKFENRPKTIELILCQTYYEKSYHLTTKPGTVNNADGAIVNISQVSMTWFFLASVHYSVPKRTTPTVTLYNPYTGAIGSARNTNAGTDHAVMIMSNGSSGFSACINGDVSGVIPLGNTIQVHWVSNARL